MNGAQGTAFRSDKAWAWTAPVEVRQGLYEFMTACAEEPELRGFVESLVRTGGSSAAITTSIPVPQKVTL